MHEVDDDIKFRELLEEKRHKELKGALRSIMDSLNNKKDNGIYEGIEHQAKAIEGLVEAVGKLPAPQVKIETNQEKVVDQIDKTGVKLLESSKMLLEELKKYNDRPIVESFEVTARDKEGYIKTVKVIYKK